MADHNINIRAATPEDTGLILGFIRALARYEKMEDEVMAQEEDLRISLFGENPKAHVVIGELDGKPAGFALYFYNYSTFLARPGLYLEDLYVNEESRGSGLGKALILHLAAQARKEGCGRMEWWVLDWNTPSIDFYKSLGAVAMDEWTVFRLDQKALEKLTD